MELPSAFLPHSFDDIPYRALDPKSIETNFSLSIRPTQKMIRINNNQ